MSKYSKKERKQLKKQKQAHLKSVEESVKIETFRQKQIPSIKRILKSNWGFIVTLILICIGLYANTLNNQLTLVDDMQVFTFNPQVKDLVVNLKSLNIRI